MNKRLKIIIFDGSFKTTPFINRLVKGLAVRNDVYILGFNVELPHRLDRVHYVPLGSNQIKLRFVITTLSYAIQTASVKNIFETLRKLFKGERHQLQKQNLDYILSKIQPDIIHLQWPSVIPWFEEVLIQNKIPVVLSQRGGQNNVRPFVDKDNFEYLEKWYPQINGFHSVSKSITINSNKIWNSLQKVDKVVYTGLPLKEFPFQEKRSFSHNIRMLSVGRAHYKKGYDYALQTCKILKDEGIMFYYTIIGGAGDEELQFLVADLGLQDYVTLEERLPQIIVFNCMKEASLFLLPSVEEGLPNVVVEAMALGLPVLSTNCDGVPELIEDGVEGWLVPIRDPKAMAEGVVAFSELPLKKIEEVRIAARKKVESQHSEEAMVLGMENLYADVISANF